jgi:hypothetical protein
MMPPDNAVVLSVDEKPSIQALERAQGYLKLPNGRAMERYTLDLEVGNADDKRVPAVEGRDSRPRKFVARNSVSAKPTLL